MTTYSYETAADGLCEYATKAAAIRNASQAKALIVKTDKSKVVWRNPAGGECRGEICYPDGTPFGRQPLVL